MSEDMWAHVHEVLSSYKIEFGKSECFNENRFKWLLPSQNFDNFLLKSLSRQDDNFMCLSV